MSDRKTTPNILGEILSSETLEAEALASPTPVATQSIPVSSTPKRAPRGKATSPGKSQPPVSSGWEHRVVTFQDSKGWRLRYEDGKKLKNWQEGPLLHEYIELLSEQGWELIAASSGESLFGRDDRFQLFFKRPRQL